MVYCTIHAYTKGDPDRMFRGVAQGQVICGEVGGVAEEFPYLYFYNPVNSLDNRYCLKSCPTYQEDGSLSVPACYGNPTSPSCTAYTVTIS